MVMETPEALQQRVRREQQMIARLRLAMTRLANAEQERIWGHCGGKGSRAVDPADCTGHRRESDSIHQLLQADEARAIPVWLSQLGASVLGGTYCCRSRTLKS